MLNENTLLMTAQNNQKHWSDLYDKYSPVVYGTICRLTDDKTIADEILVGAFLHLKQSTNVSINSNSICPCLFKHTLNFATEYLIKKSIPFKKTGDANSLINTLCPQHFTIKDLALKFNTTEEEIKKNLRKELLAFRALNTIGQN